jgi:hypothetical protein
MSVHDQSISELYVHNLLLRPYQMHKPICLVSIAPGTVLSSSQFVHLGNALLELIILALLVAVSLILAQTRNISHMRSIANLTSVDAGTII